MLFSLLSSLQLLDFFIAHSGLYWAECSLRRRWFMFYLLSSICYPSTHSYVGASYLHMYLPALALDLFQQKIGRLSHPSRGACLLLCSKLCSLPLTTAQRPPSACFALLCLGSRWCLQSPEWPLQPLSRAGQVWSGLSTTASGCDPGLPPSSCLLAVPTVLCHVRNVMRAAWHSTGCS